MTKQSFPSPESWLEHYISYGETDGMGVVYYAEYLHLFERARSLHCRDQGMSYKEMEKRGVNLPVRKVSVRYRSPARFEDHIQLRCAISKWGRASVTFIYEMYDETRTKILAEGMTEHACVTHEGRPFRLPDWLIKLFD